MDQPRYVDPNSGAAPQPGGVAGFLGGQRGHAVEDVQEFSEAERVAFREYETQAAGELVGEGEGAEPREEGDAEEPESGEGADGEVRSESERVDLKAQETQAAGPLVEDGEETEDEDSEEDVAYDPSEHSVGEVNEYIEAHPEQRDAVIEAERAGKARKGITGDE
jgi:hypothetical protein